MKIKNKVYRQFLDEGIIQTVKEEDIQAALKNVNGIRGKYKAEARALLILLYYTGCRPNEALQLSGKDISRDKHYITVLLKGSKGGTPRTVYLPFKHGLVKELWGFVQGIPPVMLLFWHYANKYKRVRVTKKGETRETFETTDRLRYFFKRWFKDIDITPYVLRHNRLSKLAMKGATMEQLRQIKGAKSFDSVMPYLHLSKVEAQKVGRKID